MGTWSRTEIGTVLTSDQYHAGQRYYVEVDIIMDRAAPLKVTHDVSQSLQRKLEGTCPFKYVALATILTMGRSECCGARVRSRRLR